MLTSNIVSEDTKNNNDLINLPPTDFSSGAVLAWRDNSHQLAKWTKWNLLNRSDFYGSYYWWKKKNTYGIKTAKTPLTAEVVCNHYEAIDSNRVGVHSYNANGVGKWICIDIDAHDGECAINWQRACVIIENVSQWGITPLVEHSNGKFGFHIWLLFDNWIDAKILRSIGLFLRQDKKDEVFPKQFSQSPYGNFVRLPGKHYKSDWCSDFYDPVSKQWLRGADAVQYLLNFKQCSLDLVPDEAKNFVPPPPEPKAKGASGETIWRDWSEYAGNLGTLDILMLSEDRLTGKSNGNAHEIVCPWEHEHTTSTGGTAVFVNEGMPGFKCLHSHCEERGLPEYLAVYDTDFVDQCCAEKNLPDLEDCDVELDTWGDLETKCVPPKKDNESSSSDDDSNEPEQVEWGTYDTATGKKVQPKKLFEDWSEFSVNCEPEDWLIKNWLEFGSLAVLAGEPFSGKSHLVTDVIAAMVQGRKWARYDVPDVPIIIIDAENKKRILTKRMTEALDYGVDPNIYSGKVKRLDVAGVRDLLPLKVDDAADTIREWIMEVKTAIKESTDCEKMFVIIDTMRSVFDADEMEAKEMKALLYPLQRVAQEMNAAVLVLHHRPKSKAKYSGGSAIPSACDYFWVWDSEKEDMTGELELYGTRGDHEPKLHFQLRNGRNYYNEQKTAENIDGDRFFKHVVEILNGGEMKKGDLTKSLMQNKGYKNKDELSSRICFLVNEKRLYERKGDRNASLISVSRAMETEDENTL